MEKMMEKDKKSPDSKLESFTSGGQTQHRSPSLHTYEKGDDLGDNDRNKSMTRKKKSKAKSFEEIKAQKGLFPKPKSLEEKEHVSDSEENKKLNDPFPGKIKEDPHLKAEEVKKERQIRSPISSPKEQMQVKDIPTNINDTSSILHNQETQVKEKAEIKDSISKSPEVSNPNASSSNSKSDTPRSDKESSQKHYYIYHYH